MKNKKGFTLIEILIVLVVLVTVTAGATIGIKEIQKRSEERSLKELYTMIETAADTYLSINDEYREELLNDEITEKCIRIYNLQKEGLLKDDINNPVTKKRIPGNLCVISYVNDEGLIENHFDLDDDLTTHKVKLVVNGGVADAETKTVYTKAIFDITADEGMFILNGSCDGGAILKIDNFKVIIYGVKKDQTCTVNLKNSQNKVTVNVVNGTSVPTESIVEYGKNATFTLNPKSGHHFESLSCKGGSIKNNVLTVSNVTDSLVCEVKYAINTYNITVNAVNGSVTPTNVISDYGSSVKFKLTPKDGYSVNGATTNCEGASIDSASNSLVISNINKDQTCTVTLSPIVYLVTLNNQSATSSGTTSVYYEYNTTRTINNLKCYYYADSTLKTCITSGTTITKPSRTGYTFAGYYTSQNGAGTQYVNSSGVFINNIYKTIGNKTLYAKWLVNSYKVTLNVTGGTGSTSKNIEYNSSGTFSVLPSDGYSSAGAVVSCDGGATITLSSNTVTVSGVTKAQTCTVKFSQVLFLSKLLANNPTVKTRTDFSKYYIDDNTGTLFKSSEAIAGISSAKDVYYFSGNAKNNWVKFGTYNTTKVVYRGYFETSSKTYYMDYDTKAECDTGIRGNGNDEYKYIFNKNCEAVTLYKKGDSMYWKIIRTNHDSSIRLLYSGTSPSTTMGYIGATPFNESGNGNYTFVGYKYGTGGSIDTVRQNTTNSSVKTYIDDWYKNNFASYTNYLSKDAVYCNPRTLSYSGSTGGDFETITRLDADKPTLNCLNVNDAFSANNSSAKLDYPVGLITADEITFAGSVYFDYRSTALKAYYYTNSAGNSIVGNGNRWWTMSPSGYTKNSTSGRRSETCFGIFDISQYVLGKVYGDTSGRVGQLLLGATTESAVVRPVISLKSCVLLKGGNGSASSPYEIALNGGC